MSSAIERFKETAKRARDKGAKIEQSIVRKSTICLVGAGTAYATKKNFPKEWGGVPSKLVGGGLATIAELMTKGATQRFFGAASDSLLAIYSHEAVEAGAFVAGDSSGREV